MKNPVRMERGFTMLEVLVALLILMVGLLGLAGLLVTTQQGEVEAYQRKQATVLLQDIVDRMTANNKVGSAAGDCYAFTTNVTNGTPFLGTGNAVNATFNCTGGSTSQNDRGKADLAAWNNTLLGTSELKGAAQVGAIIDARGCIMATAVSGEYVVSVAWRGLQPIVESATTTATKSKCAFGQYTADDRLRRVISVTIRIAKLTT